MLTSGVLVVGFLSLLRTAALSPVPGEVCFTSREVHPFPVGNPDTRPLLNTTEAAEAFDATRMDWVYTVDPDFIRSSAEKGWPVTTAINANVPDKITGTATYDVGRIEDLHGHKLTAPWMRTWPVQPYYGCINNPAYRDIVFNRAATLMKYGSAGLQHDDPHCNAEAVTWPEGGCYCSHCMAGFGPYAHSHHVVNESTFDYKAYLISKGGYNHGEEKIRDAFVQFQQESVVAYHVELRRNLTAELNQSVVLSCNNGVNVWDDITMTFDFGMGELSESNCKPDQLLSMFLNPGQGGRLPFGKQQIATMPKLPVATDALKVLTRKAVGLVTALAGFVLVPWDIYLPNPNATRFFGNVSDFVDQYAAIRMHADVLGRMGRNILHTWKAGPAVVKVTRPDIYWTVFRDDSSGSMLLHVVDWNWADDSATLRYPLPANNGTQLTVCIAVSNSTQPSEISVVALTAHGNVTLPFNVTDSSSMLSFTIPGENLIPWAMILITGF